MATTQAARVTGLVLRVDERSGTKVNQSTGEMREWSMTTVRVLVGGEDICDVTWNDRAGLLPDKGDVVDLLIRIGKGTGGYLNIDAVSRWTDEHSLASA